METESRSAVAWGPGGKGCGGGSIEAGGNLEIWGRDGWTHYLDCGDGFWIIYVDPNLAQYALQMCVIYCLSLHLNKPVCCCCFLKEGSEGEGDGKVLQVEVTEVWRAGHKGF